MKWLCSLLFWVSPAVLMAQSFAFPVISKSVRSVGELVPSRWHIKDSVRGDLNKDGRADIALVLEYADTVAEMRADSIENTAHPRILLVLFRDTVSGGYYPICQNNTFITREGEGGMINDAYGGIGIDKGVLTVGVEFLHETLEYRFRWQKGDLYLIGASDFGANGVTGDTDGWEFNFSTLKAKHTWQKHQGKEQVEWKVFKSEGIKLRDMRQIYTIPIFTDVNI